MNSSDVTFCRITETPKNTRSEFAFDALHEFRRPHRLAEDAEIDQGAERGGQRYGHQRRYERPHRKQRDAPIGDVGADHHDFAVGDVEKPHGAVDEIEAERDQRIDGPRHQRGNQQLGGHARA